MKKIHYVICISYFNSIFFPSQISILKIILPLVKHFWNEHFISIPSNSTLYYFNFAFIFRSRHFYQQQPEHQKQNSFHHVHSVLHLTFSIQHNSSWITVNFHLVLFRQMETFVVFCRRKFLQSIKKKAKNCKNLHFVKWFLEGEEKKKLSVA